MTKNIDSKKKEKNLLYRKNFVRIACLIFFDWV